MHFRFTALFWASMLAVCSLCSPPAWASTTLAAVIATAPYQSPSGYVKTVTSPQGPYAEVSENANYGSYGYVAQVLYQFSLDGRTNTMVDIAVKYDLYTAVTTDATGPQSNNPNNNAATASAALLVTDEGNNSTTIDINNEQVRILDANSTGVYLTACSDINSPGNCSFGAGPYPDLGIESCLSGPCPVSEPSSLSGVFETSFPSNTPITVNVYASVGTYAGGNTGFAIADPEIDVLTPGFTLNLPAGIANTDAMGAVPEPSAWLLMISGFGMVGAVFRARRARGRGKMGMAVEAPITGAPRTGPYAGR